MAKLVDMYVTNEWPKERHQTHNNEPSQTRQEFAEECDINSLMKKYEGHSVGGPGMLQHRDPTMFYADFTQLPGTLQEYHAFMDRAQTSFMTLPAAVRREFDNDATMFVEFASDPENLPQMRTWGLAPPEKAPGGPIEVRVVNPTSAAPPGATPGGVGPTHGST